MNKRVAEGASSNLHDFTVYISWWQIHCTYLPPCRNHDNKQAVSCTWKPTLKSEEKRKTVLLGSRPFLWHGFFMHRHIGKMSIAIIFWGWEVIAKDFKMFTSMLFNTWVHTYLKIRVQKKASNIFSGGCVVSVKTINTNTVSFRVYLVTIFKALFIDVRQYVHNCRVAFDRM